MAYIGQAPANKPLGASDITDGIISNSKLAQDIISAETELAESPASTDEFLISDGGVLKRLDASLVGGKDYEKLSSTTPSTANTFSIDGFFTSDYDIYKIYVIGVSGASMSNTRVSLRVNVGGSAQTGSNYYHHTNIASGSSVNGNWNNGSGGTDSDIGYAHNSSGSTAQAQFEFTIFRPLASDKTSILHDGITADNGSTWGRYSGFTVWNVAEAISGITLGCGDFGSGNLEADRILVYGLKI